MTISQTIAGISAFSTLAFLGLTSSARALPLPDTGSCNSGGSPCLQITNNGTGGIGIDVLAPGFGLAGRSPSIGVVGAATGTGIGVFASGASGKGLLGYSSGSHGVHGYTGSSTSAGVHGSNETGDGVYGLSNSGSHSGVAGFNNASGGIGVFGLTPSSGTGAAIYGEASNSSTSFAGYFAGRVRATSYITASDARLKNEIQDLPYGGVELGRLRAVSYKWKDGDRGQRRQLGLIAQEVQKTIPELVETDAKSGLLSVNYQALVPVVIKSFQEQQAVIKKQEARIAALEKMQSPGLSSSTSWFALGLVPLGLIAVWRRRRDV